MTTQTWLTNTSLVCKFTGMYKDETIDVSGKYKKTQECPQFEYPEINRIIPKIKLTQSPKLEDYPQMFTGLGNNHYRECCVKPVLDKCYWEVWAVFNCNKWRPIPEQVGYEKNDRVDDVHTDTVIFYENFNVGKTVYVAFYPELSKVEVS